MNLIMRFLCTLAFVSLTSQLFPSSDGNELGSKVIYDITSLVKEVNIMGNKTLGNSILRNLHGRNVGVHFEMDSQAHDVIQVSNFAGKMLIENDFKKENLVYISIRNITSASVSNFETIVKTFPQITGLMLDYADSCKESYFQGKKDIEVIKGILKSHRVRFGVKYNADMEKCPYLNDTIEHADFLVLKLNFTTQVKFPESFGIFRHHIKTIFDKNIISNGSNFLHLKMTSVRVERPPNTDLDYNLLLDQFSKKISKELGINIFIEFSHFQYLSKVDGKVTNIEREIHDRSDNVIVSFYDPESLSSGLAFTMEKVSSVFSRAYAAGSVLGYIRSAWNATNSSENFSPTKLDRRLAITAEMGDVVNGTEELFKKVNDILDLREELERKNIYIDTLTFYAYHGIENRIQNVNPGEVDNLLGNISSGCLFIVGRLESVPDPGYIVNWTKNFCSFIFNHATKFTWYLDINFDAVNRSSSFSHYVNIVQPNLNKVLLAREELLKIKPTATVEIKMPLIWSAPWLQNFPNKSTRNFYCHEETLVMNEYYEGISNWARIHNFPILMKEATDWGPGKEKLGWWHKSELSKELSQEAKQAVDHLLMRNYPQNILNYKVDPCVEWTEGAPKLGIKLDKDFSGISVSMNVRNDSLNMSELENMLLFAVHKFKTVELLPRNGENGLTDLQTLNSLMATDFLDALIDFDILGGKLFIEISVDSNEFPKTFKEVGKLARKIGIGPKSGLQLEGVHITNWERNTSSGDLVKEVVTLGQKHGFQVGLVVQNCSAMLNSLVASSSQTYFPTANYIICPTKNFPAYNEDKLDIATSLDTQLYMRAAFQKFFPELSVFYRLNSFNCCGKDDDKKKTRNLFRFLNDVNQFAVGNKLKYFLVQAFTITSGSSSSSSWFHVETFTELSNASVFVDREKELFITPTWRPDPTLRKNRKIVHRMNRYFWGLLVFGVPTLTIAFVISCLVRRKRVSS